VNNRTLCFFILLNVAAEWYIYSDKGRLSSFWGRWNIWLIHKMVRSRSTTLCWLSSSVSSRITSRLGWDNPIIRIQKGQSFDSRCGGRLNGEFFVVLLSLFLVYSISEAVYSISIFIHTSKICFHHHKRPSLDPIPKLSWSCVVDITLKWITTRISASFSIHHS
jgi:hypothetical protein